MGPLLFNVFIHDLFYYIDESLYNFADDNTLSRSNYNVSILTKQLCDDGIKTLYWFETNFMKANPEKFQGFSITDSNELSLALGDISISIEDTVKLLGLHIDDKLVFDLHISKICKKAAFHVNAIRRLAKYLNRDGLLKLFHAFIRSNFQYANIIWHFTSNSNVFKMEKLQRRALRIILNDYTSSYRDLLLKANTCSLYISRVKAIAIETFKCINKMNPKFLHDFFTINDSGYNLRDTMKILPPKVRTTTYGLNSFKYEACRIWNTLPKEFKVITELPVFISLITKWPGPQCACSNCVLCMINLM